VLNPDFLDCARATFDVLGRLEPELLDQVERTGQEVQMPAGSCLFRLGDRCDGFGFVIDGSVKVSVSSETGREMVSRLLENFADQGLVTLGRKRIAIEDSRLLENVLGGR